MPQGPLQHPSASERSSDGPTLEGEVLRVTFSSATSNFRVIQLEVAAYREKVTVTGTFPEVHAGARVRVRGKWVNDAKYGEQFQADHVLELLPSTIKGLERYLGSGLIPGIGAGYARRIVETFGLDSLRILDEAPGRLGEVSGLGARRAQSISRAWKEHRSMREALIFLQAHGATGALAMRIYKRYGSETSAVVARDPYRLAMDVAGVGFRTADRIAEGLGIAPDAPSRIQAGVLQALVDASEMGHTAVAEEALLERAMALLPRGAYAPTIEEMERASRALGAGQYVATEENDAATYVALRQLHIAEERLASRLAEMVSSKPRALEGVSEAIGSFVKDSGFDLAEEQMHAVDAAARHAFLILTGGPGVGKTTIVRAVLSLFTKAKQKVVLTAPTGRAAKRLSESTRHEAMTLHRLLEFEPKSGTFLRDAERPIEADVVIADEASMMDVLLADSLTQAIGPKTRLILVGDVDQLPSVGPGAVLKDLLATGKFPSVRLTQIFRQAEKSFIVRNAHLINRGLPPLQPQEGEPHQDFFVVERRDPEEAKAAILEIVTSRIARRFGLDPVRDVQVLTPMHKGSLGSLVLNEELQARLNPHGRALVLGTKKFCVGDKVMQLKNNYDHDVWNGDIGFVRSIDTEAEELVVRFDEGREVVYDASAASELTLAYACTIHKSQGSEYPAVVLPLSTAHFVMLTRNLLYTAVTRGKQLVVLVADPKALSLALAEARKGARTTLLQPKVLRALRRAP